MNTEETIIQELETMQSFLEIDISDDVAEVEERGSKLQVYMARSGKMLADAKNVYNKSMKTEIVIILKEYMVEMGASHTAVNTMIKAACHKEQYIVDWIERINRTCTHQLDWCRTLISKYKEEMRMNTYGGGGNNT